jgi:hypothetical protein
MVWSGARTVPVRSASASGKSAHNPQHSGTGTRCGREVSFVSFCRAFGTNALALKSSIKSGVSVRFASRTRLNRTELARALSVLRRWHCRWQFSRGKPCKTCIFARVEHSRIGTRCRSFRREIWPSWAALFAESIMRRSAGSQGYKPSLRPVQREAPVPRSIIIFIAAQEKAVTFPIISVVLL